jgi:hypothetical protein
VNRIFTVAGNIPTKRGLVSVSYGMARLSVDNSGVTVNLWPGFLMRVFNGDTGRDGWTVPWPRVVEVRVSGRKRNAFVLVSPPQNCRVILKAGKDVDQFTELLTELGIPLKRVETTFWETFRGLQDP